MEEGFSLSTLLAGAASVAFVAYIAYKISKQREELRNTIELVNNDHTPFVGHLESLVASCEIQPIVI